MKQPSVVTVAAVVAALLAGAASLMVYNYLKGQSGKNVRAVKVATAASDIAVGTRLAAPQIKLASWPRESLPPGYNSDANVLVGRLAVRPMNTGDAITEQKLMPQNGTSGSNIMNYIVPEGHRAVTVAVNEVAGVAGFITPSSRVDIVLTIQKPGQPDREENISKIILQNVPVLATGQATEQKDGKPVIVPTVTLDLVPEDTEKLIVGTKKGSLQLLLRNVVDVASVDTKGATVPKALGATEAPVKVAVRRIVAPAPKKPVYVPPPKPAPSFTVEVIKGAAKSRREFAQER